MKHSSGGALAGLRILDVTHALAGPFCTQVLADHGADVIKIEPPEGDFFRRMGPYAEEDASREFGGYFQSCNRNKRGMVLDLKSSQGRALFKELAAQADAVVENYRAGVMDKLGLGYAVLRELNPRLVYTSVRGYGDDAGGASPYRDWPAFDVVAQAFGGWMGITGPDAAHPTKVGGGPGDTVPGLFAAFGTMAALWRARESGQGQYVDIAMVDSILALSELVTASYSYQGVSPVPAGNGIPGFAPFGTVAASDGTVVIAAPHDPQWAELCRLMDKPGLARDPRFDSEARRWAHRDELIAELEAFTRRHTKQELKDILGGRVPFSPIHTAADIFADPHFAARDMLPAVEHPGLDRPVQVPGVPVKLSHTPGGVRRRAQRLGEHTEGVLRDFGVDEARIKALRAAGAIA